MLICIVFLLLKSVFTLNDFPVTIAMISRQVPYTLQSEHGFVIIVVVDTAPFMPAL